MHQRVVDVEERGRGEVGRRRERRGSGFIGSGILAVDSVGGHGLVGSHGAGFGHGSTVGHAILLRVDRSGNSHRVTLLSRTGCSMCARAAAQLAELSDELGFTLTSTDVDVLAAAGDTALRAEFGDRLPVVLLDDVEHSYWEVDEEQLRADLAG